jgi:hypothetical protein
MIPPLKTACATCTIFSDGLLMMNDGEDGRGTLQAAGEGLLDLPGLCEIVSGINKSLASCLTYLAYLILLL